MFNSLCRWAEHFSRRLLSVMVALRCSLVCYNCSLKSQWWVWISVELLVVYLCFCDLQQTQSWLWTLLAISSSCACMQSFWLWINGKPRLEESGLPSKTFEMLQKWAGRGAATRNLVNGNILYSWSIVKRVRLTFRGRENTSWIVTWLMASFSAMGLEFNLWWKYVGKSLYF